MRGTEEEGALRADKTHETPAEVRGRVFTASRPTSLRAGGTAEAQAMCQRAEIVLANVNHHCIISSSFLRTLVLS